MFCVPYLIVRMFTDFPYERTLLTKSRVSFCSKHEQEYCFYAILRINLSNLTAELSLEKTPNNRKPTKLKTLTRVVAATVALPIAGIIALSGAGSAFAITCPSGYVPAVAGNGAEFCSPLGDGGVGGGGTGYVGGNGGSTVPGQAPPVVSGGGYTPPQPPPAYIPPPANVAPAPAPAPVAPRPVAPAPVPAVVAPAIPAPAAPAGQAVAPANNSVEPPSAPQEAPVTAPEPSKPAAPSSETPKVSPSVVASSAPLKTESAEPSSSPTSSPTETQAAISGAQTASVSPLNISGITLGAGLIAVVLLGIAMVTRLSFSKAGKKVTTESEEI